MLAQTPILYPYSFFMAKAFFFWHVNLDHGLQVEASAGTAVPQAALASALSLKPNIPFGNAA